MNLVITNQTSKTFQNYQEADERIELFICGHISLINKKNNTYLTVQMDIDTKVLIGQGYIMDQAMFDRLVLDYNKNLLPSEKKLDLWPSKY
ncbi:hypothetical protein [Flavobacterium anhuiense]|uniref:hypothetical protein n=1 Tax=Flavobacterium anhuiense TaxID=459526 RepID=UPI000E6CD5EE|nr:hypothetical protein [Flavobacterium anhuiense]